MAKDTENQNNTPAEGAEGAGSEGAEGGKPAEGSSAEGAGTAQGGTPPEQKPEDTAALKSAYEAEKKKRREEAKELKELREYREQAERDKLSADDKLKADLAAAEEARQAAEARVAEFTMRQSFQNEATKAGMNPLVVDDVFLALKASGSIKMDDAGEVDGLEAAINGLKVNKPLYFEPTSAAPGNINSGHGSQGGGQGPGLNADQAMAAGWFAGVGVTPDEYQKNL